MPSYSRSTIAGWVLDVPAIAGDLGFKGSKKEGPVRIWAISKPEQCLALSQMREHCG